MYYERIKELRTDSDLTMQQIADELKMYKTTYVRYETGERELPFEIAIKIAQFHKVSLDYLAGISDKK